MCALRKGICLYSTYSSILVINVCDQGKTSCSPCISSFSLIYLAILLELTGTFVVSVKLLFLRLFELLEQNYFQIPNDLTLKEVY